MFFDGGGICPRRAGCRSSFCCWFVAKIKGRLTRCVVLQSHRVVPQEHVAHDTMRLGSQFFLVYSAIFTDGRSFYPGHTLGTTCPILQTWAAYNKATGSMDDKGSKAPTYCITITE